MPIFFLHFYCHTDGRALWHISAGEKNIHTFCHDYCTENCIKMKAKNNDEKNVWLKNRARNVKNPNKNPYSFAVNLLPSNSVFCCIQLFHHPINLFIVLFYLRFPILLEWTCKDARHVWNTSHANQSVEKIIWRKSKLLFYSFLKEMIKTCALGFM